MNPDASEGKVHRAVARAHLRTRLPIFTHTPHESCASCAMEQMEVIEGQGVDLSHVVIGHMATLRPEHDPLATHTAVARRGRSSVSTRSGTRLRFAGVPEETIRQILVDNPRRLLAFVPTV